MRLPDRRLIAVGDTAGASDGEPAWGPPPAAGTRFADFETFCRSGYGVVRSPAEAVPEQATKATMLHFMGAFSSRVQKHADDLSALA